MESGTFSSGPSVGSCGPNMWLNLVQPKNASLVGSYQLNMWHKFVFKLVWNVVWHKFIRLSLGCFILAT